MEEADALGDKIVILSGGRMRACGDQLYLKEHYGKGYQISLIVELAATRALCSDAQQTGGNSTNNGNNADDTGYVPPSAPAQMEIAVPAGAVGGQTLQVQSPDGQLLQVINTALARLTRPLTYCYHFPCLDPTH
jgi:ABC-type multidrug transport system ATPase subunit